MFASLVAGAVAGAAAAFVVARGTAITRSSEATSSKVTAIAALLAAVGALATPVVVIVIGSSVTAEIGRSEIQARYVQLAVDVLSACPDSPEGEPAELTDAERELRAWAVEVLSANSPQPLREGMAGQLESCAVRLESSPSLDPLVLPSFGIPITSRQPPIGRLPDSCTIEMFPEMIFSAESSIYDRPNGAEIDSLPGGIYRASEYYESSAGSDFLARGWFKLIEPDGWVEFGFGVVPSPECYSK